MFSRRVEESFERACESAGLNPKQVEGVFRPRNDEQLRKLTDLIRLYAEAFRTLRERGYRVDEVLEDLASVTDFSLSVDELARAWDEYFRKVPGLVEAMVEYGLAEATPKGRRLTEFVKPRRPVRRSREEVVAEAERLAESVINYLRSRGRELEYELSKYGKDLESVSWSELELSIERGLRASLNMLKSGALGIKDFRARVKKYVEEIDKKVREALREAEKKVKEVRETFFITPCPTGEEPLSLETVWGILRGEYRYKVEAQLYVISNFSKFYPGQERPAIGSRDAQLYVDALMIRFSRNHPTLAEVLKQLNAPVDPLKHFAWCPKLDKIFKVRARYVRGKYREELDGVVSDTIVIDELRKATAPVVSTQAIPTPKGVEVVGRIERVTPRGVRPFGMLPQPAYVWTEPRRILGLIGDKCLICGEPTNKFVIRFSFTVDGMMITAFCPKCMVTYWWIPVRGIKGVNPPTNFESFWRTEWVMNLDKLHEKGWVIGPYERKVR